MNKAILMCLWLFQKKPPNILQVQHIVFFSLFSQIVSLFCVMFCKDLTNTNNILCVISLDYDQENIRNFPKKDFILFSVLERTSPQVSSSPISIHYVGSSVVVTKATQRPGLTEVSWTRNILFSDLGLLSHLSFLKNRLKHSDTTCGTSFHL